MLFGPVTFLAPMTPGAPYALSAFCCLLLVLFWNVQASASAIYLHWSLLRSSMFVTLTFCLNDSNCEQALQNWPLSVPYSTVLIRARSAAHGSHANAGN